MPATRSTIQRSQATRDVRRFVHLAMNIRGLTCASGEEEGEVELECLVFPRHISGDKNLIDKEVYARIVLGKEPGAVSTIQMR